MPESHFVIGSAKGSLMLLSGSNFTGNYFVKKFFLIIFLNFIGNFKPLKQDK